MSGHEQEFVDLFAEVSKQQAELAAIHERVNAVSVTVHSNKRLLTVTAGPRGDITKLKFNNGGYRDMSPAELSALVTDTINRARSAAAEKVREAMGPFTGPGGMTFDDLQSGNIDLQKIMPTRLPSSPKDMLAFLRGRSVPADPAR